MKKISGWILGPALLVLGGFIYFFVTLSLYEPSEDLFDFPVPKRAALVQENPVGKSYDWSFASEENGIPFGYELVLKVNGWEKGEREGASVFYTKGSNEIDLISTSKHLNILKVE